MIAWGGTLGDDGVDQVAEYVQIIGGPSAESHPGKADALPIMGWTVRVMRC